MTKLAANLSMLFNEVAFLDRFAAAAKCGFKGVEFLFPYDWPAEEIAKAKDEAGVEIALFNLPPGDWDAGERGFAALPGREADFDAGLAPALDYAKALGLSQVHCMAGVPAEAVPRDEARRVFIRNLQAAADHFAKADIKVLIEPINTRDIPGYFLNYQQQAIDVITAVGRENVFVQMDFYHCQVMEGDLLKTFQRNQAKVRHVQIAGNPGRHEPDTGEINYANVLPALDALGYGGWIGCEYKPMEGTTDGLGWAAPYGVSP